MAVANITWGDDRHDQNLKLVSVYFKYSPSPSVCTAKLRGVLEERYDNIPIGADTNGHSPLWHCNEINARGRLFEELVENCELRVLNRPGHLNTYEREEMGTSNVDVSFASRNVSDQITE